MKRFCAGLMAAALLCCTSALADEAGVLTETELGAWLNKLLLSTANVQPMNAPVGEESLTENGYAFLYDSATLYYDKPVLDAQSVLQSVAVTDESLDMPRGIRLGAPADMLISAYGWQNPTLAGDESFAPLYRLNQLPNSAYWAWAQRSGDQLQSVQCAIHAREGEDRYTDAGILYTAQNGEITAIRVYGLHTAVTLAEVEANLSAVGGVPTTGSATASGVTVQSDAEPFGMNDLQFSRIAFTSLTEKGADTVFGQRQNEDWAQDDQKEWLHTLAYPGATLVFSMDQQKQNVRLESLTVSSGTLAGPRGLTLGMQLDQAIALFRVDGAGSSSDAVALLYGDGQTPPYGTLERTGNDATLRYVCTAADTNGTNFQVALHLTFANGQLVEMMLYRF